MDKQTQAQLRQPFPAELIGKRPQPTCRECSHAPSRECGRHHKAKCDECGQYITSAHIHLDFVGHADITDRLLSVDPDWSWEPVERDIHPEVLAAAVATGNPDVIKAVLDAAPPKIGQDGTLWIRLTVAGVTRLGFGDAQGKRGPNAVKEAIGDALRNAAMRFGVGLDMWRKEAPDTDAATAEAAKTSSKPTPDTSWAERFRERIAAAASTKELQSIGTQMKAEAAMFAVTPPNYDEVWAFGEARYTELNGASA